METNAFATYVASLGGKPNAQNPRLAMIVSQVITAVSATVTRDVDGKIQQTPSASLLLENGETIIVPISTVGRTTGRNIADDDLYMLENAKVVYFLANAVEGDQLQFRPNSQTLTATTTNILTTVHALQVAPDYKHDFLSLPAYHIDIDTTKGAVDNNTPAVSSGDTLQDSINNATSISELKTYLTDARFADIDAKVAGMRSIDNMRDAMLSHLAGAE